VALDSYLARGNASQPSLVVCPTSLVENWRNEARKLYRRAEVEPRHVGEFALGQPGPTPKERCEPVITGPSSILKLSGLNVLQVLGEHSGHALVLPRRSRPTNLDESHACGVRKVCAWGPRVGRRDLPKEDTMHSSDIWTYRERTLGRTTAGTDLVGYSVEAIDGSIGKVDEATYDVGSAYVIVDTGPWIFGKKVMLPAGIIQRIDHDDDRVFVNRTKEQIKNAPELDQSLTVDESYRTRVGSYYGIGGAGYREWDDDRL